MIGFALRLTLAGGREAIARLVVIAAAVALGVGLLLVAVAGLNAVDAKNLRDAWLNSGTEAAARSGTATGAPLSSPTGTPATRSGSSARPRCPRRTRWSSSSAVPPNRSRTCQAPSGSTT